MNKRVALVSTVVILSFVLLVGTPSVRNILRQGATAILSLVPTYISSPVATFTYTITPTSASKPNIVVIMTDDQDAASIAGMPKTRTLIGNNGVMFDNSYVDFSLCCPSRSSFLTGQAAHNHGVVGNKPEEGGGYATFVANGHESNQIGLWFQQAGYITGLIGKVLNGYGKKVPGNPAATEVAATHVMPGWNEWNALTDAYGTQRYFDYSINHNGVEEKYGHTAADYKTDVLAGKAVSFINTYAGGSEPFFLLLTPNAPHSAPEGGHLGPYPAPRDEGTLLSLALPMSPNFNESDVSDKPAWVQALHPLDSAAITDMTTIFHNRRESLLAVDDMVQKVVNALSAKGVLGNTYIIFTSDNGYALGAHRWESKQVVYEESIRVPLIMRGPNIPVGEHRGQLVNNLDVVATILDWASVNPGNTLDGRSLKPVIANSATPWRTALLVQGTNGPLFDRTTPRGHFFAVLTRNNDNTKRNVYVENRTPTIGLEKELYDLAADPYELTNKVDDSAYQTGASILHTVLIKLSTCTGNSCWYNTPFTFSTDSSTSAGAQSVPLQSSVNQGIITPSYSSGSEMIQQNQVYD